MATIAGTEHLTANRLIDEIRNGARFTALRNYSPVLSASNPSTRIQYVPPRKQSAAPQAVRHAEVPPLIGWWAGLSNQLDTYRSFFPSLRHGIDITVHVLRNAEHIFARDFASPEELRMLHSLAGEVATRKD